MSTDSYEKMVALELRDWKQSMASNGTFLQYVSASVQRKVNRVIPEKVHVAITNAIREVTRGLLFGAGLINIAPVTTGNLQTREIMVRQRIKFYRDAATAEGAITGAGGILLGLADFPIWLGLKLKMLCEIAAHYGKDITNLKERIFILYIFELTFSKPENRKRVFRIIEDWENHSQTLPADIHQFDWRKFQQEYRDYIDIAKLLQLVPGIGAAVGAIVNHKLTDKLGTMAMNAYRLRGLEK